MGEAWSFPAAHHDMTMRHHQRLERPSAVSSGREEGDDQQQRWAANGPKVR